MNINVKQIISLAISLVFFGATFFLIYTYFIGGEKEVSVQTPLDLPKPVAQNLLPYGSNLKFDSLEKYNEQAGQAFQYPAVNATEIGISPQDIVKPVSGQ